jgi:GTP-binding protein
VLQKALKQKLKPIVIINKVDRPSARAAEVEQEVFNLFCDLEVSDELLEYPLFFSSGKEGWVKTSVTGEKHSPELILDKIIEYVQPPTVHAKRN